MEVSITDLKAIAMLKNSGTTPEMVAEAARRNCIDPKARAEAVRFLCEYADILEELCKGPNFCNTDCARYRQGDCPFRKKNDCPRYKDLELLDQECLDRQFAEGARDLESIK